MSEASPGIDRLATAGLVAVVRAPDARGAIAAGRALAAGGITAIEVAFTTPSAEVAIAELVATLGDGVCVGAGTVLTPAQVTAAAGAGAEFLVSPGCDDEVLRATRRTGRPMLPGVLTPSDVLAARRAGVTAVKLFPGSLGGPAYLRALREPFPDVAFMPTGGVDVADLGDWFAAGAFAVGVAGALCPPELIESGRLDEIAERARRFVAAVASVHR